MDKFINKMEKIEKNNNKDDNDKDKNEEEKNSNINLNDIAFIKNSLEYYDNNQEKNKNKFSKVNYISIEINNKDLEHDKIIFYDSNFKELFRSRMEKIGLYDKISSIWTWAWAIPYLKKNETTLIRKILMYGTELDPSLLFLKTELITSRLRVLNRAQLDLHCAVASYLSKKPLIYNYTIYNVIKSKDNINYIDILNPDYSKTQEIQFQFEFFVFLLDEIK
jgi:hypothetical protein